MRSQQQIERRLRQRRFRHQSKYLEAMLNKVYFNCRHNVQVEGGFGTVTHVCTNPELAKESTFDVKVGRLCHKEPIALMSVCDSRGGRDQSKTCPLFDPRKTPEKIKDDFKSIVSEHTKNMERFASVWPDMAQLIWVLDPSEMKSVEDEGEKALVHNPQDAEVKEVEAPGGPWAFFLRILRMFGWKS